jgi:hypothetical protein
MEVFALYLVLVNFCGIGCDDVYTVDFDLAESDCIARLEETANAARILYGDDSTAYVECVLDEENTK